MAERQFVAPKREILQMPDMHRWEKSHAYRDYTDFLVALNEAVKCKPLTDSCAKSDCVDKLIKMLDTLDRYIDETPPIEQPQRFGNKAFRTWHARLSGEVTELIAPLVPAEAVVEVAPYLVDSFGNATRIDYGTGHEACFAMFLLCFYKLELLTQADAVATVNIVFERYLRLVRKLQQTYRMEPAGSHGVWSLDDYQFLPFYFGSSQLVDHPRIEPAMFVREGVAEGLAGEFMFMSAIAYINSVKTGPFAEHSNQLYNISGVPTWAKVNGGLLKMYKAEVLAKFPVVQHFLFGSLINIEQAPPPVSMMGPPSRRPH